MTVVTVVCSDKQSHKQFHLSGDLVPPINQQHFEVRSFQRFDLPACSCCVAISTPPKVLMVLIVSMVQMFLVVLIALIVPMVLMVLTVLMV